MKWFWMLHAVAKFCLGAKDLKVAKAGLQTLKIIQQIFKSILCRLRSCM